MPASVGSTGSTNNTTNPANTNKGTKPKDSNKNTEKSKEADKSKETNKTKEPDKSKIGETLKQQSKLDKDAFMRLFLEQLKHQDPTAPMETEKILEQTAMLTQLEQQEEMKKTLAGMTNAMRTMSDTNTKLTELQGNLGKALTKIDESLKKTSAATNLLTHLSGYNSVGMIGKIAETNLTGINIKNNDKVKFDLYFDEKIDASKGTPKIKIYNSKNELVREMPLNSKNGAKGYVPFEWDAKDNNGANVPPGSYRIVAEYNFDSSTNKYKTTYLGRGEVQSLIYQNGLPYLRLGNQLTAPLGNVVQVYDKAKA